MFPSTWYEYTHELVYEYTASHVFLIYTKYQYYSSIADVRTGITQTEGLRFRCLSPPLSSCGAFLELLPSRECVNKSWEKNVFCSRAGRGRHERCGTQKNSCQQLYFLSLAVAGPSRCVPAAFTCSIYAMTFHTHLPAGFILAPSFQHDVPTLAPTTHPSICIPVAFVIHTAFVHSLRVSEALRFRRQQTDVTDGTLLER